MMIVHNISMIIIEDDSTPTNHTLHRVIRVSAHLLVVAAALTLTILWSDQTDWVKIPIILGILYKSFEMFVSRSMMRRDIVWGFITFTTVVYTFGSVTFLSYPDEVVVEEQTQITLDFDESLIGECTIPHISSSMCFGDINSWYATNYSIEQYEELIGSGVNFMNTLQGHNMLNMTDEQYDECHDSILPALCGVYLPMCDHSCQPVLPCYSMCRKASRTCAPARSQFQAGQDILESLAFGVGASTEIINTFMSLMSDFFGDCSENFANSSETRCMSTDGYLTNLTGMSTEGVCTPDNAIKYNVYIDNLEATSTSEQAALERFEESVRRMKNIRMTMTVGIVSCMTLFQFVALNYGPMRQKCFHSPYEVDFSFLSLFCRLRVAIMSILGIVLCFILRSTFTQVEMKGFYLFSMQIVTVLLGLSASSALSLQDEIASKYVLRLVSHMEMKTTTTQAHTPLGCYRLYCNFYRKYFSSGGKFEYVRYVISESLEVSMQLSVTFGLSRTEDTIFLMVYVILISANLIISPILLLHPSPMVWRVLNRIVDSALDIGYIMALYISLTSNLEDNLEVSDIVLGMLVSSIRLSSRIYFFSISLVRSEVRWKMQSGRSTRTENRDMERGPSMIDKRIRVSVICLFVTSGTLFLLSTIIRITLKSQECGQLLGQTEWRSLEDHVMFPEGLFGDISCNFADVKTLSLSGSSLTEVSPYLYLLENLETLDLSYNDLTTLPVDYLLLKNLMNLNVTGNPVSLELDWSRSDLREVPSDFLNLIPTLEKLDLSNNTIKNIEGDVLLTKLKHLDLSMNCLQTLSSKHIVSLESLSLLNMSRNNLTEFDEAIWLMSALTTLDLRHNLLTEAPYFWPIRLDGFNAELQGNPIEYVDWRWEGSGPKISRLPDSFTTLEDVRYLDLSSQALFSWNSVTYLPKLEYLDMSYSTPHGYLRCTNRSLSYSSDVPTVYCDNNIKILNSSGHGTDLLCGSAMLCSWTSLEHIVATDLYITGASIISAKLENLNNLKTLDLRNSPIRGFELFSFPVNLTMVDMRNTSMSLSQVEAALADFDCRIPIPFVCTR